MVVPFTKLTSPASLKASIEFKDKAEYKCFEGYTVGGRTGSIGNIIGACMILSHGVLFQSSSAVD